MTVYVGMSGWTFPGWKGTFYPKGLAAKKELHFASRQVTSIEVNGTFRRTQKPATFEKWYEEAPKDFCFSLKAPQFITHIRRLKDVDHAVANFLASGVFCLKEKLGVILWQFPPNVTLKDDRFEKFLKLLPYDSKAASRLSKKHSDWLKGWAHTKVHGDYPVRHAFEFRHPSFCNEKFIDLLRKHGVAVVFAHSGKKSPYMEDLTADFIYARMHGEDKAFKKGYTEEFLDGWTKRLGLWKKGQSPADAQCVGSSVNDGKKRDAFIYFDNEVKKFAPKNAMELIKKLRS